MGAIPSGQESQIPKNKGNLEEARNGKLNNLMHTYFKCRNQPTIHPCPQTDDDGNAMMNGDDVDDVVVGDVGINVEEVDGKDNVDLPQLIDGYPPTATPP